MQLAPDSENFRALQVLCYDLTAMQISKQLNGHTGPVSSAAFSRDGKFLVTVGSDCSMRLWGSKNLMH